MSVDNRADPNAKRRAKGRGVSASAVVEPPLVANPPILQSLRGVLTKANISGYRKHLTAKYR
jgi:hypothetical protein